jgi:hypothetical protein
MCLENSNGRGILGDRTVNGIVTAYIITYIGQTGGSGPFKYKDVEYGSLGLIWLRLQASEADYCDQGENLLVA